MRLRQILVDAVLGAGTAAAVFASLPAVANADTMHWGASEVAFIYVLIAGVIAVPIALILGLVCLGVRARNRQRARQGLESIRREQEYIRELEEKGHKRRELGDPEEETRPWLRP